MVIGGMWLVSVGASYRIGAESATEQGVVVIASIAVEATATPADPAAAVTPAEWVVRGVLAKHVDEDNPRNRNQRAYVAGGAGDIAVGQVGIQAVVPNRVLFTQYPGDGAPLRTFSIAVDGAP